MTATTLYYNNYTIGTGASQGCVLPTILFFLYINNYTRKDPSVELLKFADNTTVISLIQDGDESAYRQEVKELAVWCSYNNLELNSALFPISIMNITVAAVESFRFLDTISQNLKWEKSLTPLWKRPSRGWNSFTEEVQPATGAAEAVLLYSYWVCPLHFYNYITTSYKIRSQKITEDGLDCWEDYWCSPAHPPWTQKITLDSSHPCHFLFELLPSVRHYRALSTSTARHKKKFLPPSNLPHEQLNVIPDPCNMQIAQCRYVQYHFYHLNLFDNNLPLFTPLPVNSNLFCCILHTCTYKWSIVYFVIYLYTYVSFHISLLFIYLFFTIFVLLLSVYWKLPLSLKQILCVCKHNKSLSDSEEP